MANIPEEKKQTDKPNRNSLYMKTFGFALEFGFITALPLIGFSYLGKFLDNRYQTNNKMFLYIGIVLALVTTTLLFIKKIKEIIKEMQK